MANMNITQSRKSMGLIAAVLIGVVVIAAYVFGWYGGDPTVAIPAN
jgi:hypothetical protein